MGSSLIVEARGFDAAQIAAFNWDEYILIPVQSEKFRLCQSLGLQRSKIGSYEYMDQFLIVEARGFGTAEIATLKWNEYSLKILMMFMTITH